MGVIGVMGMMGARIQGSGLDRRLSRNAEP
jgi:hypothetical protein